MEQSKENLIERAKKIEFIFLDVDGTLTDGGIYLDAEGGEMKKFDVRDGSGIVIAKRHGLHFAMITGRKSKVVARRASELGIDELVQGALSKLEVFESIRQKHGFEYEQVAYIGDDWLDISIFERVGLAACVADAFEYIKKHAHLVTKRPGGHGAVREVIDFILSAKGHFDQIEDDYLSR